MKSANPFNILMDVEENVLNDHAGPALNVDSFIYNNNRNISVEEVDVGDDYIKKSNAEIGACFDHVDQGLQAHNPHIISQ